MASLWSSSMFVTLVSFLAIQLLLSTGEGIGIDYGRIGDNLPSPQDVIGLYKKCNIQNLRLYDPSSEVSEALRGSNLQVTLGVRNEDIQILASSQESANQWVNTNIAPYKSDVNFQLIVLGNEIIPGVQATFATQAMQNLQNAINSIGITETKVTTSFNMDGLAASYPPSAGAFTSEVEGIMKNVVDFLTQTGAPLMVHVYPYFAYASDQIDISFEYATFQATTPITDGSLQYFSLFDAMVDSIYAALEKIGATNVSLVIGETGWPSAGNEPITSIQNAQTYNKNLLEHLKSGAGTPRRPGQSLDTFIFALFNEDQKQGAPVEKNWGLFYPNMSPVYPLLDC